MLQPGTPVTSKEVEDFVARVAKAPFKEVAMILLGSESVQPCPVCGGQDSRLDVLDCVGMCYGKCGKTRLGQIFDIVYRHSNGVDAEADCTERQAKPGRAPKKGTNKSAEKG